jgi:hypothetical protein
MPYPPLRELVVLPDFDEFRRRFDDAMTRATAEDMEELRRIGSDAFQAFFDAAKPLDVEALRWFAERCDTGVIDATPPVRLALRRLRRQAERDAEVRRHADSIPALRTRRVVQLSWFGFAGFQASDVFEVRRSVFHSPQERQFCAAAALRFPGLCVMPNYPLWHIVDLERLETSLPEPVIRYGRACVIDALLVTPREGDPVAAFELDSSRHDEAGRKLRDEWKNALLSVARIPLYRLRSEDPTATSVDEWYSVLTDEVLDKVDCGARIRSRDIHATLVPILR